MNKDKKYEVELTYITSRENSTIKAGRGIKNHLSNNEHKSPFFDMLHFILVTYNEYFALFR